MTPADRKHNLLKQFSLLAFACCTCTATWAFPVITDSSKSKLSKGVAMDEVVVTGQYAPSLINKAVQKIKVIDRAKIDAMSAQNLRDVLTNEMNVRLSQDNILGSGVSIQGIGGENVKILVDGVPVIGRQDGNIDVSQINLHNTERIEIVEGPMSVNYGSDALAGTINIITKKSQKDFCNVGVNAYYESIGTYNLNTRLGFHRKKHTVILTGGRNFFEGWSAGKQFSFLNFGDKIADSSRYQQWKPKEQYVAGLQYIFNLNKSTTLNYKGDFFNEVITNRGVPGIYGQKALDDYYRTRRLDNAVFLNSRIAKDQNLNLFAAYNAFKRTKNTFAKDLTTLDEVLSGADGAQDTSRYSLIASRGSYTTSFRDRKINFEVGYDINIEGAEGVRLKNAKKKMGDYAAYASAEYKPVDNLTVRPGLRYAYNTNYDAPLVPSLHLRYKVSDFTIRASYARGFRAPSLKELYFDFHDINHDIDGNPDLKAEYSNNYNMSVVYANNTDNIRYNVELGGFYNDIKDRIQLALLQGQNTYYTYVNIGRYKTLGTQINISAQYKKLKVTVGASYIGRYNSLFGVESGVTEYSFSPEFRANLSYILPEDITLNVFYKYTGKLPGFSYDSNGAVTATEISAYHMSDISLSRKIYKDKLLVAIGAKNLFNVQNLNINGAAVSTGAAHATSVSSPVSTGRSYFLRLDLNITSKK